MAKRTKEEIEERHKKYTEAFEILLERVIEKDKLEEYREYMIHRILEIQKQDQYTRAELLKKSTSQLENVFANVK